MKIKVWCVSACVSMLGVLAQAAPLVIEDGYIQAGVSDAGTLGSNGSVSPGILFDPVGQANYGVNDFLTPGTPFEGFYLVSDQDSWDQNNDGGTSNMVAPFTLVQNSPTQVTASSTTSDDLLAVTHQYTLVRTGTQSEIQITTTLVNKSTNPITHLKALRTLDPDPDVNTYEVYDTINTTVSNNKVCGTGAKTDQTICLYTQSAVYPLGVGVSAGWTTDPDFFLAGKNDGTGDHTIGIAFNIGTLAPGASAVLDYRYLLSETLAGTNPPGKAPLISGATPVPAMALFGPWGFASVLGMGCIAGYLSRRRKNLSKVF